MAPGTSRAARVALRATLVLALAAPAAADGASYDVYVDRADDIGVTNLGGEPRFVEEHRDKLGLLGDVRVHDFNRDEALKALGKFDDPAAVVHESPTLEAFTKELLSFLEQLYFKAICKFQR